MRIKLHGINKVTSKGRLYNYHRRTGTRLKSEPGSPAFMLELEHLDKPVSDQAAGTLSALIEEYKASPEWIRLGSRTQEDYQAVFEFLKVLGSGKVTDFDAQIVISLRDMAYQPAEKGRKTRRRFANYVVQVLRLLFSWAKPRGWLSTNPASDIPLLKRPKGLPKPNRAWTREECETVLEGAPIHMKWPISLAMYAGLREGDIINAPVSMWRDNAIDLVAQRKTGNPVWMPAHRELAKVKAEYDAWAGDRLTTHLCINSRGQPWTQDGFSASFRKLLIKAKTERGLTMHGLRHTAGKNLADAGADPKTIAAMLGHSTIQMAEHYSKEADRKRASTRAVKLLEDNNEE